jgi:hypothetical protein
MNPDTDSRSAIKKISRLLQHAKVEHRVHKQQPASEILSTHLQPHFSNTYANIPTQLRPCLAKGPFNVRFESHNGTEAGLISSLMLLRVDRYSYRGLEIEQRLHLDYLALKTERPRTSKVKETLG